MVGLSDDQKAMLRLLAQREQGYEDIAALMGLSVDEVRARVRDALAQLEEEGAAPPPLPAEPAAPEPPTPAEPEPEPEPPTPAESPVPPPPTAPEPGPAPAAEKPEPAAPQAPAAKRSSGPPRISLPSDPGPRAAIVAGVLVVAALVVVLILSGGSGSDSANTAASGTTAAEPSGEAQSASGGSSKKVTKAVLEAVDGSGATGVAIFGRYKEKLALQIEAEGLKPVGKGEAYTIWLAQSPQKMLPLASDDQVKGGRIAAQFVVPTEVLAYLANETFDQIAVTLTSTSTLEAALKKATSEKKAPVYTGTEVLRGTVVGPIVGAAKREKAE